MRGTPVALWGGVDMMQRGHRWGGNKGRVTFGREWGWSGEKEEDEVEDAEMKADLEMERMCLRQNITCRPKRV